MKWRFGLVQCFEICSTADPISTQLTFHIYQRAPTSLWITMLPLATSRTLIHCLSIARSGANGFCRNDLSLRCSIATATTPCLAAAKKKKRIRSKPKHSKRNGNVVSLQSRNIKPPKPVMTDLDEQVKEWNAKVSQAIPFADVPFAEVKIPTGPPPTMSAFEFEIRKYMYWCKIAKIFDRLGYGSSDDDTVEEALVPLKSSILKMLLLLLASDPEVPAQDAMILRDAANASQTIDRQQIDTLDLSEDTATTLDNLIFMREDFNVVRILDTAATPEEKDEILQEIGTLSFKVRRGHAFRCVLSDGDDGMIPTPLEDMQCYTGNPVESTSLQSEIKRGDIVLCVALDVLGVLRGRIFRVTGLAGDVVKDVHETIARVPEGHFWAEGDQKWCADDSRVHGPVPLSNVRFRFDPLHQQDHEKAEALARRPVEEFILNNLIFPAIDIYLSTKDKLQKTKV